MSIRFLALAVALFACTPGAGVNAPCVTDPGVVADPAHVAAPNGSKHAGPVCGLLAEVDAAREVSRQMNGDATILKYSTSFTEHATVVGIARAAGAVAVEPMIVLGVDVIGAHGFRSVAVRGTDASVYSAFRPYVIAGSIDAIERTDGLMPIAVGAELAAILGANVGDPVAIAYTRSDWSAMTPTTRKPAPAIHRARVAAVIRYPGGALTSFGTTVVLTSVAHAATIDSAAPQGNVTGVTVWMEPHRDEQDAKDALTKGLGNAMYHVVGPSELDSGFRASVEALRAYCNPSPM